MTRSIIIVLLTTLQVAVSRCLLRTRVSVRVSLQALLLAILAITCLNTALGDSRYVPRTLEQLIEDRAVVAEVRIEWIRVQRAPNEQFDDLFCECTVLQGFKMPFATNRLILRLNFAGANRIYYEHKTAVLFAYENKFGDFSPSGPHFQRGLVLTNQVLSVDIEVSPKKYANARREYKYDELIREIKKITEANKRDGSSGRKAAPQQQNSPIAR